MKAIFLGTIGISGISSTPRPAVKLAMPPGEETGTGLEIRSGSRPTWPYLQRRYGQVLAGRGPDLGVKVKEVDRSPTLATGILPLHGTEE